MRLYLIVQGVLLVIFGGVALMDPMLLGEQLGVEIAGRHGTFEFRGIYGGVSLGAGIVCLLGAFLRRFSNPGLMFLAIYMGGYLIGRAAAIGLEGQPEDYYWAFIGYEAVSFLLALLFLSRR